MRTRWIAFGVSGAVVVAVAATTLAASEPPTQSPGASAGSVADSGPSTIETEHGTVEYVLPEEKIVAIDEPIFRTPERVRDLGEAEPVLALSVGDEARAYPLRYLIFHEIVNDVVGGEPVVVTYCPLCNSGVAFRRPEIDGRLLDFGVSGRLLNANLVMVDRQTSSLWSQALGEAVSGELTGVGLEFVPAQIVSWQRWHAANPHGTVLAQPDLAALPKGVRAPYGANPYIGYDRSRRPPISDERVDNRLRGSRDLQSLGHLRSGDLGTAARRPARPVRGGRPPVVRLEGVSSRRASRRDRPSLIIGRAARARADLLRRACPRSLAGTNAPRRRVRARRRASLPA